MDTTGTSISNDQVGLYPVISDDKEKVQYSVTLLQRNIFLLK